MNSSGNEIVDSLIGINFSGNIIPQNWYKTITTEKGKPDLTAIVILADILYWYRPTTIRSEETGEEIGLQKKFADNDYLQRNYRQLENQFGVSKRSARNAVVRLESIGVIERITRNVLTKQGAPMNNVMYLKLNVPRLLEITFPDLQSKKEKKVINAQNLGNFDITNKRDIPLQEKSMVLPKKERYHSFISKTNTENTAKINTKNTYENEFNYNPIYPSSDQALKIIKENISYDILMSDKRIDKSILKDLVTIMVDIFNYPSGELSINSNTININEVKKQFLEINQFHIEYVLESISKLRTPIKNYKNYILTVLYNSPMSMNLYYSSEIKNEYYV